MIAILEAMSDHSNEVTEVDGAAEEAKEESVRSGTTDIEASPSARSLYEDDIVVWDENDAENPYNWSVSKRVLVSPFRAIDLHMARIKNLLMGIFR